LGAAGELFPKSDPFFRSKIVVRLPQAGKPAMKAKASLFEAFLTTPLPARNFSRVWLPTGCGPPD
jgi:hypothetical protein